MNMQPSISFIIPTYNEVESIGPCLKCLDEFGGKHQLDYELIVVDSGSTDGTTEFLKSLTNRDDLKIIYQTRRLGMGVALKAAYSNVTKQVICHYECDQPFDLEFVLVALDNLKSAKYNFVLGARIGERHSVIRYLYTAGYRLFISTLFGVNYRTINFSFKVFSAELLDNINIQSTGWFIDAELVIEATRHGAKIKEIPIDYLMRSEGQSTVRWQDVFAIINEALRYARSSNSCNRVSNR